MNNKTLEKEDATEDSILMASEKNVEKKTGFRSS